MKPDRQADCQLEIPLVREITPAHAVPHHVNELKAAPRLRATLKNIHNYVYANDPIKQHARVFEEISKVLFAKLYDEASSSGPCRFFIEYDELQKIQQGNQCDKFPDRINKLYGEALSSPDSGELFASMSRIELSTPVFAYAVQQLQWFSLSNTDAKGAAFQAILAPQLRSEKGQFFTPDPVKRLLVEILDPRAGEIILDPACGSGGLLISAMSAIECADKRERTKAAASSFFGIELDPALARVARLSFLLEGDGHTNIVHANALGDWRELSEKSRGVIGPGSVDVILTNPPFGSRARVDQAAILRHFPHLAAERKKQVPETLFVERIVQLLKPGGRAGIVLPIGQLGNSSLHYVREFLRSNCHIFATISLPPETFRPAENGVRAGVLFILKHRTGHQPRRAPTFRAISRSVGYDIRERPIYRKDDSGNYLAQDGSPLHAYTVSDSGLLAEKAVLDEDISDILRGWMDFRRDYGERYLW